MKLTRPVWAEINLDNLAHNIKEVKSLINKNTKISAVIKADAYGHGALAVAQTLLDNGADSFAVATFNEALQLRRKFKDIQILILGYTPKELATDLIENELTQTIYSYDEAKEISKIAKQMNKTLKIHIKIDSGMNRLGLLCKEDTIKEILQISKLDNLFIEGIFTHFAIADEKDKTYTKKQVEKFNYIVASLDKKGLQIPIKHVSNSAAIIDLPQYNFDMVRAGIMIYGLYPSENVDKNKAKLKEVMSLKTKIAQVKTVEAGSKISYGLTYECKKETKIATLPIGYADGFTRLLSNKTHVFVNNKKAKVLGTICMDQSIIDVTDIDVKIGDEVIIFGNEEKDTISATSIAKLLGTINYEIVCMVNKRVPRVYLKNNSIVDYKDYVLMINE